MQILFVTPALSPLTGDSSLGHLTSSLGGALCALGHKVTAVVPLQQPEVVDRYSFARRLSPMTVELPDNEISLFIFDGKLPSGVEVRLLANESLYQGRPALDDGEDEPLRQDVLARAALLLGSAEATNDPPLHVIHGFSLAGAMISFHARNFPPTTNVKRILSVDDLSRQGRFDRSWVERLGLSWDDFTPEGFEFYGDLNMLKAGLVSADRLLMPSLSSTLEAVTADGGHGLEGVLSRKQQETTSLLPGLDYARWTPATDIHLPVHFDAEQLAGKRSCKASLQHALGLPVRAEEPLIALAPPLEQLAAPLASSLERLLRSGAQLVAPRNLADPLGSAVTEEADKALRQIALVEADEERWHQTIAAADLLLLDAPLDQRADQLLAGLRYGALPVVRPLGLARDLVVDLTGSLDSGNGFLVHEPDELLATVQRALTALRAGPVYHETLSRTMSLRCSWEDRARALEDLYSEVLGQPDEEG